MANITRRRALLGGLAGATVAAAGGLAFRSWSNGVFSAGQGSAYQPWHDWREAVAVDGPEAIVAAGILAANAHNTQPWLFKVREDSIELHADLSRHLGAFDPYRREMTLSLGCALENMVLAARAQGMDTEIELPPARLLLGRGPDREGPAAILRLTEGDAADSVLFRAIASRHTHRGAYDTERRVHAELQDRMLALAEGEGDVRLLLHAEGEAKDHLGDLIVEATRRIIADHEMAGDSANWFRFDWKSIVTHRDGVTLDGVGLPPVINAVAKLLPPPSAEDGDRQWFEATRDTHVPTAALLGLITVQDLYDRPTAIRAGMLWQRLHLWATAQGLVAQPLNQPPEMVDREAELSLQPEIATALGKITGEPAWRPTFAFRMGYAARPARLSPRRGVHDVMTT